MPSSRPRIGPLGFALCAALGVVGLGAVTACGEIDGSQQPFAGTTRYQDPGGAYELSLLEPPWIPVFTGTETIFVVPPSEVINLSAGEANALYSLHVNGVDGDPAGAMASAAATSSAPWDLSKQRPVKALSGAAGVEVSWQEAAAVFHREVFLNGASAAPTFHLHFTAKKAMADDDMITQMVLSFAPRGTTIAGVLP